MTTKIIISGFGGQGIILAGRLLAYSAMLEGKEVSHFPSYGAEVRGGTCNCSVIISDREIASPIVSEPDITLVLNQPSKNKFEPRCKSNGRIFVNKSMVSDKVKRDDLDSYYVDATNLAEHIGNIRATNMVMLGSLIKVTDLVKLDTMINALGDIVSSRNESLIAVNAKALKAGYDSL